MMEKTNVKKRKYRQNCPTPANPCPFLVIVNFVKGIPKA